MVKYLIRFPLGTLKATKLVTKYTLRRATSKVHYLHHFNVVVAYIFFGCVYKKPLDMGMSIAENSAFEGHIFTDVCSLVF